MLVIYNNISTDLQRRMSKRWGWRGFISFRVGVEKGKHFGKVGVGGGKIAAMKDISKNNTRGAKK